MSDLNLFVPIRLVMPGWPTSILAIPLQIDLIGLSNFETSSAGPTTFVATGTLQILRDIEADLPLIPGLSLVAFNNGDFTELDFEIEFVADWFSVALKSLSAGLRFQTDLLKRMEATADGFVEAPPDPETGQPQPVEVLIDGADVTANSNGEFAFTFAAGAPALTIQPCMIGETGIIIDVTNLVLVLSNEAALAMPGSIPSDWRGVYFEQATIHLPEGLSDILPQAVAVRDAFIGAGGFCGSVSLDMSASVTGYNDAIAKTAFGFGFTFQSISIDFKQNALTASSIKGFLKVPFFDEVLQVEIGLTNDGDFTVGVASDDGLLVLEVENVLSIEVSGIEFAQEDGVYFFKLSGKLTPQLAGLDWPSFDLKGLTIGSDGNVKVDSGWIDLPEPQALDLYGFRMEISRIGFGNEEDGRRWIGFSGGVHLIELLPTGVSVEGLRVIWDPTGARDPELTLQGIGLELTVPGALHLAGDVALINEATEHYFMGNAHLDILPLGIALDAAIKIGRDTAADFNYVYTFLNLELPIGIPLWATGAALYGLSGLYGMNVSPDANGGDWYAWYTAAPKFDVTDAGKWSAQQDGRAFGAGMVLGTLFDAGRVVSTKALFALILPGPVILINGKANVLQLPPKLGDTSSEGIFNLLAVLDAQAGELQMNIDAGWSLAKVIDINASAEAYFDFANPANWHLYLGQDQPESRRIRAYVVSLFHADAYLMIDSKGIAAGFGVNWGEDWKFGPVKVVLRSWIEAGAAITWQPPQLEGSLSLGGEFEVSVAGFGVGLSAEAILSGKAPTLYWVRGELILRVKLPAPIKDLKEDITLEWKEEATPPSEDPFESIGIEHLKVDETWLGLPAAEQLVAPGHPDYNPGPIVPLDARPSIAFDRSVKDLVADVDIASVNVYAGGTVVGQHTFDYEVQEVILEKWSKAGGTQWTAVDDLYGTWMAIEDGDGEPAASKLQLWAKSPFEFTRRSSRTYRDAFLAWHPFWPCAEVPDRVVTCIDWDDADGPYGPVFERGDLRFFVNTEATIIRLNRPSCGVTHGLKMVDNETGWIVFPEPVRNVVLCLPGLFRTVEAYANGVSLERNNDPGDEVAFSAEGIDAIELTGWDGPIIAKICYETEASASARESTQAHIDRIVAGLTHWASAEQILEPEMWYRLTVRLETVRTYKGSTYRTPYAHYAYFQTAGPPGLTPEWGLAEPAPAANALSEEPYPEGGKLTDLAPYIQWSIPGDGAAPVYRAYDIGAEFNENYVEQMYGADMVVRLLDLNGLPLRDEAGDEVSFLNQWAEAPTAELSETESPYVTRLKDCMSLPGYSLPPNQKLIASNGILLEENFDGDLDQWTDVNADPRASSSGWSIADGKLKYIGLPLRDGLLVAGDESWSDYAVEVELSEQGGEVGIVFRYTQAEATTYYRLRLDSSGRRLERISDKAITLLWQDDVVYTPGAADSLAIQCQGDRLRGQVDAELLFDLRDEEGFLSGKVGIYAGASADFDRFLVRQWPGGALAPQTMYTAELLASFVLFQGGLLGGATDAAFAWNELAKNKNRIATIGREDWDNYRLEVNIAGGGSSGAIVRFLKHMDGTFACYRLLINPDKTTLRLARLEGTYSGNTYELDETGRNLLWSCLDASCGIDFGLTEHDVALTCDGPTLIVELDGQELVRVQDADPLPAGQAGLYYEDDAPDFSELVIRSTPRRPIYRWNFITAQFEGLVELADTFSGDLYTAEVSGVDRAQLAQAAGEAFAGLQQASDRLDAARSALANASPGEVPALRAEAQQAASDRNLESIQHFDALYDLLFQGQYRPRPAAVELSEVVEGSRRYALLLESPEPLDWSRLNARLAQLNTATNRFEDIADTLFVWNDDGTKVFIVPGGNPSALTGECRLSFDYQLDLGTEAPVLRRSGSTLPETAALDFLMLAAN